MAAGCGCIGSDAGGIPDVIVPGINGIKVPRWQLHRLGEVILEWLDAAEADRQRIRSAAREHMIAEFSYEREAALLQTVMDRLIPSSS
jgi:glycosyltransferase involved in cell wall biosynthesis